MVHLRSTFPFIVLKLFIKWVNRNVWNSSSWKLSCFVVFFPMYIYLFMYVFDFWRVWIPFIILLSRTWQTYLKSWIETFPVSFVFNFHDGFVKITEHLQSFITLMWNVFKIFFKCMYEVVFILIPVFIIHISFCHCKICQCVVQRYVFTLRGSMFLYMMFVTLFAFAIPGILYIVLILFMLGLIFNF